MEFRYGFLNLREKYRVNSLLERSVIVNIEEQDEIQCYANYCDRRKSGVDGEGLKLNH